ncbi:MAG: hypothetical protein KAS32_01365 [Candidatus Peribacteraceae bacterium]|nr:hypothetical protein [Candidatus Peribacteraceae bacterium]
MSKNKIVQVEVVNIYLATCSTEDGDVFLEWFFKEDDAYNAVEGENSSEVQNVQTFTGSIVYQLAELNN